MLILSFDATKLPHPEVPNRLNYLTGEPINEVTGILGAYDSNNKAMEDGWKWIMRSLSQWQLPYEMEYDALPGEWKHSGSVRADDDCLVYTISDHDRVLALKAIITL